MSSTEKKPKSAKKGRKTFTPPVLHRYGAVRSLTENVATMTLNDGGSNPKIKTA